MWPWKSSPTSTSTYGGEDALLHQSTNFAHVGNFASRLMSDAPGASEVGTDMWRFGVGFCDGYGYRIASNRGRIILQGSGTFGWYTLELEGEATTGLSPTDAASIEQFTSHTRFGESWESAIEVGFGDMVTLHAGYERTAVFRSIKIWYTILSTGIDRAALWAVDMFVDEVEDASPYAAPGARQAGGGALPARRTASRAVLRATMPRCSSCRGSATRPIDSRSRVTAPAAPSAACGVLDDVAGVGPVRRRELLRRFGTVAAIRAASDEELAATVGPALAARLRAALPPESPGAGESGPEEVG